MASGPVMDQMPYLYDHIHIGPQTNIIPEPPKPPDDTVVKELGCIRQVCKRTYNQSSLEILLATLYTK